MTTQIVQVNVSITNPPTPSKLQQTGAFISQGGTTLTAGTYSLLTTSSSLTSLLTPASAIASITWSSSVVTLTTSTEHGLPIGSVIPVIVAGVTPAGYNGTYSATITTTTAMTYSLASNPGTETVLGTMTPKAVQELTTMNTTFFAQGSNTPVYVLELGAGTAAAGVTALSSFISSHPATFYSYLIPREWDIEPTFKTFAALYQGSTASTYFFVTTTIGTYSNYSALDKCIFAMVEAPAVDPTAEFSCAAPFFVTLTYAPSSSNQVTPLCFNFLYSVTAYPTAGNSTLLQTLKTANINYVTTAAEGGLSNLMIVWGHMLDGNPFNYWYTVDWAVININLDLSNEIINGSNSNISPLYYNQAGIDRLQNRAARTLRNGASYGLILGQVLSVKLTTADFSANFNDGDYVGNAVINAVPFTDYNTLNPSNYSLGLYTGLSAVITPARGFEQIIFNLNVSNFA